MKSIFGATGKQHRHRWSGRHTKPTRRIGARFHCNLRTCSLLSFDDDSSFFFSSFLFPFRSFLTFDFYRSSSVALRFRFYYRALSKCSIIRQTVSRTIAFLSFTGYLPIYRYICHLLCRSVLHITVFLLRIAKFSRKRISFSRKRKGQKFCFASAVSFRISYPETWCFMKYI